MPGDSRAVETSSKGRSSFVFVVCLVLSLLSGAAALGHETVMIRIMVDVLGANANTFSAVIGAFFLGLSLGAWIASRRVPSRDGMWRSLGLVEVTIAMLTLLPLVAAQYAVLLHGTFQSTQWSKPALSLLLVTPTATMMGLVLPWVLHALGQAHQLNPRRSVVLYAVNTAGGVLGIWYVLLIALPTFGLVGTAVSVTLLNASAAGCAFCLQLLRIRLAPEQSVDMVQAARLTAVPAQPPQVSRGAYFAILACASGFLVLGMEVTCQIQFGQISITSLFSSAGVLTMVLLGLSLSALLLSILAGHPNGPNRNTLMSGALLLASVACAVEPLVFVWFNSGLSFDPYALPLTRYLLHSGSFSPHGSDQKRLLRGTWDSRIGWESRPAWSRLVPGRTCV